MLYISNYFQEAADTITMGGYNYLTGKRTSDYFDINSLAQLYCIYDLAKNPDVFGWNSTYFYIPDCAKQIYSGPVWDFDVSFGTHIATSSAPDGTQAFGEYLNEFSFCANDAQVRSRIVYEMHSKIANLINNIILGDIADRGTHLHSLTYYQNEVAASQRMNQVLWGIETAEFGFSKEPFGTYQENVDYLRSWLSARMAWLVENMIS